MVRNRPCERKGVMRCSAWVPGRRSSALLAVSTRSEMTAPPQTIVDALSARYRIERELGAAGWPGFISPTI